MSDEWLYYYANDKNDSMFLHVYHCSDNTYFKFINLINLNNF